MTVPDDTRKQLIRLCESRRTRNTTFSRVQPTVWVPHTVIDPSTGQPFTEDAAWMFVITALCSGVEIEQMLLEKPEGKIGYVLKLEGANRTTIYVKLQLGSGVVIGRSFHLSDPTRGKRG